MATTAGGPADAAFPGTNGKIAFTTDRDGVFEIYAMDPDGQNPTNLTNSSAFDRHPVWSPDGSKIAYSNDRENPASRTST